MSDTRSPDDPNLSGMEQVAYALYYHAAEMIKAGKSREEIVEALVQKGVKQQTARNMLDKLGDARVLVARRAGRRNVALGLIIAVLGLSLVLGAFGPALTGVSLIIAWAAVIFGSGWLIRGMMQITGL